ncbi:MAG: hypothetical protein DRI74_01705 [Bacteroidetes bacterium]|nr:MAG: hypothetical protein DRI74_01705 [Bacteroidota bacterium]
MPLPNSMIASAQFIDRDFQSDNTKNNRLSIQLRLDGFSFAQIDSITNKVLLIEDYKVPLMLGDEAVYQSEKVNLRLGDILAEKKISSKNFKSVHLTIDNSYFTLVPIALFDKENAIDYLNQLHRLPENFMVRTDKLSFLETQNVYAVYAPSFYSLSDHFSTINLKHASTVFIQQMAILQKMRKGAAVYVEVATNSMHIIVFDNDKLLFSNTFLFKEKEDFIYFILLVYNQLNLKPESVPLLFSGNIDRSTALYAIAYQYIGNLEFPNIKNSGLVFGNDIPETIASKYHILTQAVLCE